MNTKPTRDPARCNQEVADYSMRFPRYHQCRFKASKDGYCKIHHPDSVKAREEKQRARYEAERAKSPYVFLQKANERISQLETQVAELREVLSIWSGDGHLQTFEDRERFRKEARATLERTK